jgi:hypothetical protein
MAVALRYSVRSSPQSFGPGSSKHARRLSICCLSIDVCTQAPRAIPLNASATALSETAVFVRTAGPAVVVFVALWFINELMTYPHIELEAPTPAKDISIPSIVLAYGPQSQDTAIASLTAARF